jgi:hypothetical protein
MTTPQGLALKRIQRYFDSEDGSLPEIEVAFRQSGQAVAGFALLFELGAIAVSAETTLVWDRISQSNRPFAGAGDAARAIAGEIDYFHVVLGGFVCEGVTIPDLGVLFHAEGLVFDYRMGEWWEAPHIDAFLCLLRKLRRLGGVVTAPWWGSDGERDILFSLDNP